jgi:hypothetical protein
MDSSLRFGSICRRDHYRDVQLGRTLGNGHDVHGTSRKR